MGFARRLRRVRENYERGVSPELTEDRLKRLYAECESDDQRAEVEYLRAQIHADGRNWDKCIEAAEAALHWLSNSDRARGRVLLLESQALFKLKRFVDAKDAVEAALDLRALGADDYEKATWDLKKIDYELMKQRPGMSRWQHLVLLLKGPRFA